MTTDTDKAPSPALVASVASVQGVLMAPGISVLRRRVTRLGWGCRTLRWELRYGRKRNREQREQALADMVEAYNEALRQYLVAKLAL